MNKPTDEERIDAWVERIRDTDWSDSCGSGIDRAEVAVIVKECIAHGWREAIEALRAELALRDRFHATYCNPATGAAVATARETLSKLETIAKERGYV